MEDLFLLTNVDDADSAAFPAVAGVPRSMNGPL